MTTERHDFQEINTSAISGLMSLQVVMASPELRSVGRLTHAHTYIYAPSKLRPSAAQDVQHSKAICFLLFFLEWVGVNNIVSKFGCLENFIRCWL